MKPLKTIIIAIAIFSTTILNNSYAQENNAMKKILDKGVSFKPGELSLNKNQNDFVRVSFRVNKENKIEVLESNSSNEFIKEMLLEKLTSITVNGIQNIVKVYAYNFIFKKN